MLNKSKVAAAVLAFEKLKTRGDLSLEEFSVATGQVIYGAGRELGVEAARWEIADALTRKKPKHSGSRRKHGQNLEQKE